MNKIGIVSGYFNPLHGGHIEYINEAKKRCDFLIAIVNNDVQVALKTDSTFMDEHHRLFIVKNLRSVDRAWLAFDTDNTVCRTLEGISRVWPSSYNKLTFFNSGDVVLPNKAELMACHDHKISMDFIHLPKRFSSRNFRK
jgi:cytidyltransferase-like protein